MTDDVTAPPSPQPAVSRSDRREDLVWWATWLGLAVAVVGLVAGVKMALKKRVVTCPDGTEFPEGTTDFDCYAHPLAELGVATTALFVVLGILIAFSSMAVRANLETRPPRP